MTDNRPAQLAGIKEGDVITKIGTSEIKEVYSYMEALSKITPGEELEVKFIRDGETKTVKVKFE